MDRETSDFVNPIVGSPILALQSLPVSYQPLLLLQIISLTLLLILYRGTLYTLVVSDPEKVSKLRQTVPESLIVDVPAKN